MNAKRAIFLALCAAALLSGCDQVLEFLYPEFKEGGADKGKVVVEIGYDNSLLSVEGGVFNSNSASIKVAFVPFVSYPGYYGPDEGEIQLQQARKQDFTWDSKSSKIKKSFEFEVRLSATYKVIAWLDVDNNNDFSPTEPSTIVYTRDGDFFIDLRYFSRSDPSIYLGTQLRASDRVNEAQLAADPFAGPSVGSIDPVTWLNAPPSSMPQGSNLYLYMNAYDEDGWIQEYNWRIVDPDGYQETRYGPELNIYLGKANTWSVYYKVKDNSGRWSSEMVHTVMVTAGDPPPTPDFWVTNGSPAANENVTFYNTSYDWDQNGNPRNASELTHDWYINGSWVSNAQDLDYSFSADGSYEVRLEVSDGTNPIQSAYLYITVGGVGSTSSNPIEYMSAEEVRVDDYLQQGSYRYFRLAGLTANPLYLHFFDQTATLYIEIYSDPGFSNLITYSYSGDPNQVFDISGSSEVYVWIYASQPDFYSLRASASPTPYP